VTVSEAIEIGPKHSSWYLKPTSIIHCIVAKLSQLGNSQSLVEVSKHFPAMVDKINESLKAFIRKNIEKLYEKFSSVMAILARC